MNPFNRASASSQRIQLEDALKHLLDYEQTNRGTTVESLAGALAIPRPDAAEILGRLRSRGLAKAAGITHHLTEDGRIYAIQVVRTHRLYETWLARETSTPAEDWHKEAHKAEHHIGSAKADELANLLNNPRFDPHGDTIPTREGHMPKREFTDLASWPDGQSARIEHLEDEPESLFREIQTLALAPDTLIETPRHLEDGSVKALIEGRNVLIPARLTTLIHLAATTEDDGKPELRRLSDLAIGDTAVVHALAPACTGNERRRLLDLGLVPGTRITCEFPSPFGSPRSYMIRGALIALRDHQAERILIEAPVSQSTSETTSAQ
ncbi:MAG: DtxR family transcriptional regulator [Verrucomicrobiales bacterium]|nr:metal-dependent transcriptional regulator [Verrucomicrobiota bacterium JB025]